MTATAVAAGLATLLGTIAEAAPAGAQAVDPATAAASGEPTAAAPPTVASTAAPTGDYLVAVRPSADPEAVAAAAGAETDDTYHAALTGFSAELAPDEVARLEDDPRVVAIEPDHVVHAIAVQSPTPSWGLDRVDQRDLPLDSTYSYASSGAGVRVYVVDTGVLLTHTEFAGRIAPGFDVSGGNANDCNGHGTHVAGTIAGATYGLAKAATVVPVRVLGCNGAGQDSGVIAGIDWAIANHTTGPAVLNMSLGGPASSMLDAAVARATADGITVTVAAGNSNADACSQSPARAPSALTVGATTSTDARSSYSNIGPCLDLFAPGSGITSAYIGSSTATATMSGTSMSAPHVAGMAALAFGETPGATAADVAAAILAAATPGKVTSPGSGSPNLLLYRPAPAPAPVATPTAPAAPAAPTAVAGDASATVRWSAPGDGGSPITRYTLTVSPGGAAVPVAAPSTSTTVTGLVNGAAYTFTVTATNAIGTSAGSPPSAPVIPTAKVKPPPKRRSTARARCLAVRRAQLRAARTGAGSTTAVARARARTCR